MKILHQRDAHHHAQNPVERAGIWDGIEVRADQQAGRIRFQPFVASAQVTHGVHPHVHANPLHPFAQQLMRVAHWRRKKRSRCAPGFLAHLRNLPAAGDHFACVDGLHRHRLAVMEICFRAIEKMRGCPERRNG